MWKLLEAEFCFIDGLLQPLRQQEAGRRDVTQPHAVTDEDDDVLGDPNLRNLMDGFVELCQGQLVPVDPPAARGRPTPWGSAPGMVLILVAQR